VGGRTRSGSAAAARDEADAGERIASDQPEARRIPARQAEAPQNEPTPDGAAAAATPTADQRQAQTSQAAILPPAQTAGLGAGAAAQAVHELRTGPGAMDGAQAAELRAKDEAHAAELTAKDEAHAAELRAKDEAHAAELRAMGEAHAAELRAAMTLASAPAPPPDHRRRARSPAGDVGRFPGAVLGAILNHGRAAARAAVGIFCTGRAGVRGGR
jgi:hypothetical protein